MILCFCNTLMICVFNFEFDFCYSVRTQVIPLMYSFSLILIINQESQIQNKTLLSFDASKLVKFRCSSVSDRRRQRFLSSQENCQIPAQTDKAHFDEEGKTSQMNPQVVRRSFKRSACNRLSLRSLRLKTGLKDLQGPLRTTLPTRLYRR